MVNCVFKSILIFILLFVLFISVYRTKEENKSISQIGGSKKIIFLYISKKCEFSKRFLLLWNKIMKHRHCPKHIKSKIIVCDKDNNTKILGYPMIIMEKNNKKEIYKGEHNIDSLLYFINN